ncbi:nucleoside-diphosphate kinase [Candidatus Nomurabacteria bacterium RIFCSPLOWO2_02_FULL_44_12]|uniref:nucleoside-diphosphate kinase n=1 Tax=Candidatus Nomurabacteria bacterium RIFCSPLOWO2_12_FULL_44_11 TaxID=1801796 RepID=A0A1F6Y6C2_9BACT|nr:MAG: nucleoside-diphosphate kinase [Candidatus Nomurabacteria bacterium RIFCSPHIGHO2_12_FULL_44_22b]OGJ01917.1 MAG: nucleoside-diphosphate kinase [Candidatus Nomurabacteria bacterium RIFCSPLOWO2_12_FULL_44_11]OGJ08574.1 MAG: nucleoside-diphosphate kinase [Candidatus Nomurabacteria bacterium RIFCSPLOWO2_02_FULL_44_12]
MKNTQERTLIIFKPDAVQRGIVGEILARFEKAGFKIAGAKMLMPSQEHYYHHYENIGKMITRHNKKIFDVTLEMMSEGPVIALVLEGIEAVAMVRKMVGPTESKSALPGTIRGDYSHMSFTHADKEGIGLPNILHASGDPEEAKAEIAHWFSDNELFDYETVHEMFTQKQKHHKRS